MRGGGRGGTGVRFDTLAPPPPPTPQYKRSYCWGQAGPPWYSTTAASCNTAPSSVLTLRSGQVSPATTVRQPAMKRPTARLLTEYTHSEAQRGRQPVQMVCVVLLLLGLFPEYTSPVSAGELGHGQGGGIAVVERQIQLRKIAEKLRCRNQTFRSFKEQHLCTGDRQGTNIHARRTSRKAVAEKLRNCENCRPPFSPPPFWRPSGSTLGRLMKLLS